MDPATSFQFEVRYRPGEYLALLRAHIYSTAMPAERRWWNRLFVNLMLGTFVLGLFAWKSFRVGRCRFEMDAHGFIRHSRGRPQAVSWTTVKKLHWYQHAMLMELSESGVPIPYRVLEPGQRERIAAWVADCRPGPRPVSASCQPASSQPQRPVSGCPGPVPGHDPADNR